MSKPKYMEVSGQYLEKSAMWPCGVWCGVWCVVCGVWSVMCDGTVAVRNKEAR